MEGIYYIAPPDQLFDEMKRECIAQWNTHDNTYGYVDEKVNRIKDIKNVGDNFMYMLGMFDSDGQAAVVSRLSEDTKDALRDRMIDGGNDSFTLDRMGL